ncbi:hypothetical protein Cflav_PD5857 [Pedosphaera parvula Ellin514]|uniref:Uncharacterized protein n=1 Tax=Pedosphaera parvula (strain Ellin514) TaxID=320771 RepID=B9X9R4_PEDPL|nr:hypothetical protein Cflav_PD5857 [Pedosphaera parvula Ellin514]
MIPNGFMLYHVKLNFTLNDLVTKPNHKETPLYSLTPSIDS